MRTTTRILSIAIIAALPFGAMAENISGAMYTAPAASDTNHPAPTTSANPLYGRVNIDVADQDHIASTAYVKGAYNSAIAAVNKVADTVDGKQARLLNVETGQEMSDKVLSSGFGSIATAAMHGGTDDTAMREDVEQTFDISLDETLISAGLTLDMLGHVGIALDQKQDEIDTLINNNLVAMSSLVPSAVSQNPSATNLVSEKAVSDFVNAKRVKIYTTWDDDSASATAEVPLITATAQ